MLCNCIHFGDIGSFDGDDMPAPPNDPSVDPNDDQDMLDADDHEASAEIPAPASMPILTFGRHGRLDSRFRLELGDQLYALIVEEGVMLATMRDIQANVRLLNMWRGMSCDMYKLMRHVVGAMTLVTRLRRTIAHYRRGQDASCDRQLASNDSSSHDCSPCVTPDE